MSMHFLMRFLTVTQLTVSAYVTVSHFTIFIHSLIYSLNKHHMSTRCQILDTEDTGFSSLVVSHAGKQLWNEVGTLQLKGF